VYKGGKKLFFQLPEHATYEIEQVIKRTKWNVAMRKEGDITVIPALRHQDCACWVTMYEIATHQVRFNRWSPESSNKLEEDHAKVKRFNVDQFHWNAEEAQARAEFFADKHNYKLM
jgi:hypothetical protein